MSAQDQDAANKVFSLLVADALEAMLPLIERWAAEVEMRPHGHHSPTYQDGYSAGARSMEAEVKDQLVERILRLRE